MGLLDRKQFHRVRKALASVITVFSCVLFYLHPFCQTFFCLSGTSSPSSVCCLSLHLLFFVSFFFPFSSCVPLRHSFHIPPFPLSLSVCLPLFSLLSSLPLLCPSSRHASLLGLSGCMVLFISTLSFVSQCALFLFLSIAH